MPLLAYAFGLVLAVAGAAPSDEYPRPPQTPLEIQVALARRNFSCGSIDGVMGSNSAAALAAFHESGGGPLSLNSPPLGTLTLGDDDLKGLQPLSPTWVGRSHQTAMGYETALEMVAERSHASPGLIRRLNPQVDWTAVPAGTVLTVPAAVPARRRPRAARLRIQLSRHCLEPLDDGDRILGFYPITIAAKVNKRPAGELHVVSAARNPNYTVDPENFPESDELRELGQKLILPPGPNNPVGTAWIGLDLPGYGIHGTPEPEHIGRTESHGCFRMTNWDADALLDFVTMGTPVDVQP